MFALDDLAKLFELTVREDTAAGGITVSSRGQTIVLSPGQGLASVGGRLVSCRHLRFARGVRGSCLLISSRVRWPRRSGFVSSFGNHRGCC